MRPITYVLLLVLIFIMVVNGVALSLGVIVVEVTGSIRLTREVCLALYGAAILVTIGLIWLCNRLGGKE